MPGRQRRPLVTVTSDDRQRVPGAVAVLMTVVNLGMAAAVTFVLTQLDNPITYVAGAPLVLVFLVTGGSYAWFFRRARRAARATSRSPSRDSP